MSEPVGVVELLRRLVVVDNDISYHVQRVEDRFGKPAVVIHLGMLAEVYESARSEHLSGAAQPAQWGDEARADRIVESYTCSPHPDEPYDADCCTASNRESLRNRLLQVFAAIRLEASRSPAPPAPKCEKCGEDPVMHCIYEARGETCRNHRDTCHAASYSCMPAPAPPKGPTLPPDCDVRDADGAPCGGPIPCPIHKGGEPAPEVTPSAEDKDRADLLLTRVQLGAYDSPGTIDTIAEEFAAIRRESEQTLRNLEKLAHAASEPINTEETLSVEDACLEAVLDGIQNFASRAGHGGYFREYVKTALMARDAATRRESEAQVAYEQERNRNNVAMHSEQLHKASAEIVRLKQLLTDAALEINCAGPVDHRIRVLKQEHAKRLQSLEALIGELVGALKKIAEPDQGPLRAVLKTNDEMRIIEVVTRALNWCRDTAEVSLASAERRKP